MNKKQQISNQKIGILGGGQLGKMLCIAGSPMGINISVLDQKRDFPAGTVTPFFTEGSFLNYDDVMSFGKNLDIITIEIENVNTDALKDLESLGKKVYPQPGVIEMIKDKGKQKTFYRINSLPTAAFRLVKDPGTIPQLLEKGDIKYPFVQKVRTGGYDGRGVQVISTPEELSSLFREPSVIEEMVQIKKELAVIVARSSSGSIRSFPTVEMAFHPTANLVEYLFSPADISSTIEQKCQNIAEEAARKMGVTGLLAVELFLDKNDNILINEVAPRPHNSGHHTIESNVTSQYEQHIRAITGLPLGSTRQKLPAIMSNLLGEEGYEGPAVYEGLEKCLELEGVHVHIYGKKITKPFRKMGHVTIIDQSLENARHKANIVRQTLKVISHE